MPAATVAERPPFADTALSVVGSLPPHAQWPRWTSGYRRLSLRETAQVVWRAQTPARGGWAPKTAEEARREMT